MADGHPPARTLKFDVPFDDPNDPRLLRGALLRARATELADLQRRDARLSFGYGTDAAREGMNAEVDQHRRRIELLDRLLAALDAASPKTRI